MLASMVFFVLVARKKLGERTNNCLLLPWQNAADFWSGPKFYKEMPCSTSNNLELFLEELKRKVDEETRGRCLRTP